MVKKLIELFKAKNKLAGFVLFGVVLAGSLGWFYFSKETPAALEAATIKVQKGNIEVSISGAGALKPSSTANIISSVNGTLTSIGFTNGQQVKKGDLLFQLSNENTQNEMKRAELQLQQAKLDYDNALKLSEGEQINAPFSGQVVSIEVEKGQDVPKNNIMMVITDTSKLVFKAPVNESQMKNIQPGQRVDITLPELMTIVQGKVQKIDRVGTARSDGSRFYPVTVELVNPGGLTTGLRAQAVIITPQGSEQAFETGILDWIETVKVKGTKSGFVQQLFVEQNSYVTQGQKLLYIGVEEQSNNINSQELKLEQARINYQSLQAQMANFNIYAPVDGIITLGSSQAVQGGNSGGSNFNSASIGSSGQTPWQVGDQVSGSQILATVVGSNNMVVIVPVDELDIAQVKLGQNATVTADAFPGKIFKGTVTEIASQGTSQNGVANFDVAVNIEKPEDLRTGMTANVEIMVASKENVLLLPIEAVQERQGREFVILSPGKEQGGQRVRNADSGQNPMPPNMKPVETGLYNESMIEITSGLTEGESVTLPTVIRNNNSDNRQGMGAPGRMVFSGGGGSGGRSGFGGGQR